jgi:23S rRNA pseudouridine2605 synthase
MRKNSSNSSAGNNSRPGSKNTFKKDGGGDWNKKERKPSGKNYDGRTPTRGTSSSGASRPARPYSGRITDSDKPKNSDRRGAFGKDDKPFRRNNDDRKPGKEFGKTHRDESKPFHDRPKRSFDKPSFKDDRSKGEDDRKPRKEFDKPYRNEDKPFSDRPKRSFDKPSFNDHRNKGDDKPRRKFDKRVFNGDDRNKERENPGPRREFDKSKKTADSRPFRDRPKSHSGKSTFEKPHFSKDRDATPNKPENEQPTFDDVMNNAFKQPKKKKENKEDDFRKPHVHEDKVFGALGEDVPADIPKRPFEKKKVNSAFKKKHFHDHSEGRKKKYIDDEDAGEDDKDINQKDGPRKEMPLNKFIAHSGECSRRDAAELVKQGKVKVNGELVLDPGYRVQHDDKVTMSGKKLIPQKGMVYILLNKPKGFITTNDDPQGRRTVMELVGNANVDRLFPVGRLDRNTSGLLLITNDGDLTQKLSHPAYNIKKVYHVTLDRPLTQADFEQIAGGVELEDGIAKVDALAYLEKKNELGLEIHSGRNRIVRRIFESLNYVVEKLDRVMYAGLTKKNLPRSKWRYLDEREVVLLKYFKS